MKSFTQKPDEMAEFAEFIEKDIANIQRVIEEVEERDLDAEFIVHAKSETVKESTENTEMEAEDIIKTLVFIADEPVAVLCPGDTTVSEEKLESVLGSEVRMADPEEVKESTGYIVGGVSPFDLKIPVYMDKSILNKEKVKPAAGSRVAGVGLDPEDLRKASDARPVDVSR